MKKNVLYIIIGVILLVFAIAAIFTSKQSSANTIAPQGNYKTVHDVQGIAFDVNTAFTSKATAISEISDDMDISRDEYYVYKNGTSKYLLFCMNDIVIAAEKGTSFNFGEEIDYSSVQNSGISGVWFESNAENLKYKRDGDKVICEVNGGFCVTSEVYEDYVGKICVMNNGSEEWGIFVGVPGKDIKYKKLDSAAKDGIEYILSTMQYSDIVNERPEEIYEVAIGNEDTRTEEDKGNEPTQITPVPTETPEEPVDDEKTEEDSEEEEAQTEQTGDASSDDSDKDSEDVEIVDAEDGEEGDADKADTTPTPEPTGEADEVEKESEEPTPTPEPTETPTPVPTETPEEEQSDEATPTPNPTPEAVAVEENVEKQNKRGEALNLSNQRKLVKIDNKAYSSSIYSMLSLKDNGIISEYDLSTGNLVTPIISIRRVYTGQTAIRKIKDYCIDYNDFNYFDPPVGCSWHLAEYYILWKNCPTRPYIDIKLKGLDGENLRYKGIKYDKRTYDIFSYKKEEDNIEGNVFCFYAVPNGCKDYVLECGTGNIDKENSGCSAAYFRVKY